MSARERTDGRTPGRLVAATAYSSVVGVPLVTSEGRRVANTALVDLPKEWDHVKKQAVIDAAFIAHAWNCHDDLVKALGAAISHIEHMAAWITAQKAGYSFEGLGEDEADMRTALSAASGEKNNG